MSLITALCTAVIAGGPITLLSAPTVTLRWTHTVEGSAWEEDYVAEAGALRLVEARISRIGAGMEPPAGARRVGNIWHYVPDLPLLPRVDLANSAHGGGYDLCWGGECVALKAIAPGNQPVALVAHPCDLAQAYPAAPDGYGWAQR
ncbi:DUF1850 domain-containing protein [Halomonas alkalisoli]|uniref:DUF1850 domain-containing protein n=1 Tax=Halomonas alkalisoli TaxID=2907158 RepID=UPI001F23C3DC|nr:DUF1850 domain-containing protein [Halomonas alkalisoli]MCE9684328.1 DUF1850 domain-containing protein [Halomonas alkalisoli]